MSATRHFPLAAVLRLREQMETSEERTLAARAREAMAAEERLRAAGDALEEHRRQRAAAIGMVSSATELQLASGRWASLQQGRGEAAAALALALERKAAQQQQFLAARRARETLGGLYENHETRWQKQQAVAEQKRLDDLFLAHRHRPA